MQYISQYKNTGSLKDWVLVIDTGLLPEALNIFELGELFCYITNKYIFRKGHIHTIQYSQPWPLQKYFDRINFTFHMCHILGIPCEDKSSLTWMDTSLNELELFFVENDFEIRINTYQKNLEWLEIEQDVINKIATILSELNRNTFEHNLWKRWPTGPLLGNMIHHDKSQKQLHLSIFDFGIGMSGTLQPKYPWLEEYDYIVKATTEWVTCRTDDTNGGIGLTYLKNCIFRKTKNYPQPELIMRSNTETILFDEDENIISIDQSTDNTSWVHIYFVLSYYYVRQNHTTGQTLWSQAHYQRNRQKSLPRPTAKNCRTDQSRVFDRFWCIRYYPDQPLILGWIFSAYISRVSQ